MKLRLGTRGSALARAQAADVAGRLAALGHEVETVIIETAGDRRREERFADVGAPGIFVAEIEHRLAAGDVDLAVHSCKDLPSKSLDGLVVAAIPERVDARDLLICRDQAWDESAPGRDRRALPLARDARIGTASARRTSLLRALRPDLAVEHLRGNVPTRIRRLREGCFDAILLAAAGVHRLRQAGGPAAPDLDGLRVRPLDPEVWVPAPSQGAIAVQARAGDPDVLAELRRLDQPAAHLPVRAERELLRRVEGGCQLPFGAWCRQDGDELRMVAFLERGGELVRAAGSGRDPLALAEDLWRRLGCPRGQGSPAEAVS